MKKFSVALVTVACVFFTVATAWGQTNLYVDGATGSDTYDGLSPTFTSGSNGPKATIQAAIDAASSGDVVNVSAGTYNETVTVSKAITLTGSGTPTIKNLTMNPGPLTLGGNLQISETLALTSGNITTGANTLIVSSTGSVSRTDGHIIGNLSKNVDIGSSVARTFEVGTASRYNPVSVTFGTVTTAGNLTARANAGDHGSIGSSTLDPSKSVNVNWTLEKDGTLAFDNYSAVFNFNNPDDLDGGVSTSNVIVGKYNAPTWTYPTVGTRSATSTEATGLASFSDFQIGESVLPSSDDFNAFSLNTSLWTFINPLGDGTQTMTGTNTANAWVSLSVPAGTAHPASDGSNRAPRIMQPVNNTDFELEVKFESGVTQVYQEQGVIVEQDNENYIRFEFYSDGSNTRVYAASNVGGVRTDRVNPPTPIAGNGFAPLYMRVKRERDQWTQSYSTDGSTWNAAPVFSTALVVDSVGAHVANEGMPPPAYTANIDYFFNTASPIVPEDGGTATSPPIITLHPASRTVLEGQAAMFSVRAVGTEPLFYQWQVNSTGVFQTISGATDTTYKIPVTTLADSGSMFRCVVTNSFGTETSNQAMLDVTTHPPPAKFAWYGSIQTFGQIGTPQRQINILGNVSDPTGITSLTYSLNGGSENHLSIGPNGLRLVSPGDFNADINFSSLQNGSNQVVIRATNGVGAVKSDTIAVQYANGNVWPLPYSLDWSTARSIQSVAQIVDGLWSLGSNSIRTTQPGYDRLVAIGDTTWTDYEVTVPITIHGTDPADYYATSAAVGILMRWKGHTDNPIAGTQPKSGYIPYGAIGLYRYFPNGSEVLEIYTPPGDQFQDASGMKLSLESEYIFKMRVETQPGIGGLYRFKAWPASEPEPPGWNLTRQQGLSSSDLQAGSLMLISHHVDASFGIVTVTAIPPDTSVPVISNVEVIPHATTATVTWTTDIPSNSKVSYGQTSAYEDGSVQDTALVSQHYLALSNLTAQTLYHFQVTSVNSFGKADSSADSTFTTTTVSPPPTIVSDEFNTLSLNSVWTFINPRGDAAYTMTGSRISISIPDGTNHDVWADGNFAPRIMQSTNDVNFEVEIKFDSPMTAGYQMQGFIVEQDAANYLRFDFYRNPAGDTRIYAASFAAGSATVREDGLITSGSPLYLKVKREGNQWTEYFSYDGTNWITAVTFSRTLVISSVGPFVGNYGSPESSAPAFTGLIDYFRIGITANLKAFLQGPFNAGSMSTALNTAGVIPISQPYNTAPWDYTGTESVGSIPSGVVDWILVQLRSNTTTTIATRAALLKSDGSVVDLDGTSPVSFAGVPAGDYYIVIRHRNHLAIMSAVTWALSGSSSLYDFTTAQSQAYGTNPMKSVGSSFAMINGDVDANAGVGASDLVSVRSAVGSSTYNASDVDMNGGVGASDLVVVRTNVGQSTQMP
jgi:hypothetical protein